MYARVARGDCWLVAVAASIAYVDSNKIKEMMVDRKVRHPTGNTAVLSVVKLTIRDHDL